MSNTNANDTEHDGEQLIAEAADVIDEQSDPPMSMAEFVDQVTEHPEYACSAPEYLLRAIEHFGTRTVIEHGEEIERWRFFDDPANDGEHAILGNTELLNRFVEDIRAMARGPANEAKMFWFEGPTATGKSELKRCFVNGLREFSKTDAGKRFTIEWNVVNRPDQVRSMSYGDNHTVDDDAYWHESPVQTNPLSVLPEEVRQQALYGQQVGPDRWTPTDMDPFSDDVYQQLSRRYGGDFEKIVDDDHLRVKRYTLDIGRGIGVLQSEDEGRPRQKLVGEWMRGMVKELDSRGRRNPQALSYDGVLSQGNNGLTVIEDAAHHFDTILKTLSVPEDDEVKIDRRNVLPIDTVAVIISNPDMRSELMQTADTEDDSFRAIRRRLDLYEVLYLVTPSLEAELLHRLLQGREHVWGDDTDRITESMWFEEAGAGAADEVEVAPHGLEAVAYYDVVSRITSGELDRVDKARLYDGADIEKDGEPVAIDDIDDADRREEGRSGIPCTFTRDVVADQVSDVEVEGADDPETAHPVVMPRDLLQAMADGMYDSPVFSSSEADLLNPMAEAVETYILTEQEDDVLRAMLHDHMVSDDEISEYIEHVYCWGTDEDTVEPDELKMKVFETEHLGLFDGAHYDLDTSTGVSQEVEEFRRESVIRSVSSYIYQHADGYEVDMDEIPISTVPEIEERVTEYDWDDVDRIFDDLDPNSWLDPLAGTETERIKEETIEHMTEMFDYSERSARLTTDRVFDYVTNTPPTGVSV